MRVLDVVRWSSLAILAAGCGSDGRVTGPNPLEQDFPVTVSDPTATSSHLGAAFAAAGTVAYVSLQPGTVGNAESATIRNLHTGTAVLVPVTDGGFDPIAVGAQAGDTLEVSVLSAGATLKSAFPVPIRVRPIVVRTDPPPQKRDVPLNASIVVVVSEPVDPGSLAANSLQLRHGGVAVAGTLGVMPGRPTTVVFTPTAPLDPGTTYDLTLAEGITDLEGDGLGAAIQVSFTTVPETSVQLLGRVAFTSDRDGSDAIYVTNTDGSGVTRLAAGTYPEWSPDAKRIAFARGISLGGPAQIYVMNADGSDVRFIANGAFPSWSPDGSQIVFSGPADLQTGGIFVMNADGSGIHKLVDPEFAVPIDGVTGSAVLLPSWSPDGQHIVFVRANFDLPWLIYIMNADGTALGLLNGQTVGDTRITWSPDGSSLLYQAPSWPAPVWSIVSVGANGGSADLRIYTQANYVGGPDWSPDAKSILFEKFSGPADATHPVGSRMRIFVVDVNGGPERQLIPEAIAPVKTDYWDHQGAWSRVP